MSFIADKQTLEDLNMLGKYKKQSVFSLFNIVETTGAEKLLAAMFQQPLQDPAKINDRSAIFSYFQQKALTFPFTKEQLSITENYLSGDSGSHLPSVAFNLIKSKVLSIALKDEVYDGTRAGLQQAVALLITFNGFLNDLPDEGHPYSDSILAAKNCFRNEQLSQLIHDAGAKQLSFTGIIKYDYLLRNVMRDDVQLMLQVIYHLDVYIHIGQLAGVKGFSYAKALAKENNIIHVEDLKHPGIDKATGNDLDMGADRNLIFLTGANMAGKSTFMKAFAINIYLAHMGFPVAAKQMTFSVKDGIYTSINVADDLEQGYSHFYAEVLRVKKVAEEVSSKKDLVIIFDELFKGTNVKDAYDATLAITEIFTEYANCIFIISTHIIEVGDALGRACDNVQLLYLPTVMNGNLPAYTYRLMQGITSDRHGMMIIENEGILAMLQSRDDP
jgi:DNA mismatch repair protein MutS